MLYRGALCAIVVSGSFTLTARVLLAKALANPGHMDSPLLRSAREAIGIRLGHAGINSLVLRGTTRQGFNGVTGALNEPGPIEIRLLLPDKYLRIDTVTGVERREGFRGGVLVSEWTAARSGVQFGKMPSPDEIKEHRGQMRVKRCNSRLRQERLRTHSCIDILKD